MSNKRKLPKPPKPETSSGGVVIAYCHPGQTSAYFTQSLMNLLMFDQATSRHIKGCLNEWSSANISTARNNATANFLGDYDAEWLLWIDADMQFPHDSVDRLLASADAKERPIMGGLCFGATHGQLFPTIYQMGHDDLTGEVTTKRVEEYPIDEVVPCAATGAAFILIHRTVLQAMKRENFNKVFPWFQETTLGVNPAGEDITFCLRAGILGFPVHVDTSVQIGHHKSILFDHAMFQAQKAHKEATA